MRRTRVAGRIPLGCPVDPDVYIVVGFGTEYITSGQSFYRGEYTSRTSYSQRVKKAFKRRPVEANILRSLGSIHARWRMAR
jgi:hypothetical protein